MSILTLAALNAQARWATKEDAPVEITSFHEKITVDKQGKATTITEKETEILNEAGREYGTTALFYNSNAEVLEVLSAKTIYKGEEYVVPKSSIEIKPLASDNSGFDQTNQVLISYPMVTNGAKLYLKTKRIVKKVPVEGFYIEIFGFPDTYIKNFNIEVESQLKLDIVNNNPYQKLIIDELRDGKFVSHIKISNNQPLYEATIDEPKTILPASKQSWVLVSTHADPDQYGKIFAANFDRVLKQELPQDFLQIYEVASKASNSKEQINIVTSMLAEKVRYMGDWRAIDGGIKPNNLADIAKKQTGDCKDFATVTTAILRKLGFDAQIAFVHRGVGYLPPTNKTQALTELNHALLRAINKDGEVFWIDPTNAVSMAGGIFPDIADRPAVIVSSIKPSYEQIPAISYQHNKRYRKSIINQLQQEIIHNTGEITWTGEMALRLTGAELYASQQYIKEIIVRYITDDNKPLQYDMKLPNLQSRIVKDLTVSYSLTQENNLMRTNLGTGFPLSLGQILDNYLAASPEQIGDSFIDDPLTMSGEIILQNVQVDQIAHLDHQLTSPWLNISRQCRMEGNDAHISINIEILRSFITSEDIKSEQYQELKKTLQRYYNDAALIIASKDNKW